MIITTEDSFFINPNDQITPAQVRILNDMKHFLDRDLYDTIENISNKHDAWVFINKYMEKYKHIKNQMRRQWAYENAVQARKEEREKRRARHLAGASCFSGPYDSDIVDCYDYGICPWGNS